MSGALACVLKRRLADEARNAIEELLRLNNEDMQAVIDGDWRKSVRITADMEAARATRDAAMDAFRRHVQEHGC